MTAGAPSSSPSARRPGGRRALLVCLLVLLVTGGVYVPALDGELVYDDLFMVARNPDLAQPSRILSFFTQPYWAFVEPEACYWRPLTATFLAVGHALGGGEPWGFHALSLAAHLGAVTAAFLLARALVGGAWLAGGAALLFALHPLQVESVAWITALNDPLYAAFVLAAVLCFLRWRERGSPGLALGAAAWTALALLSKETGLVALPLFLLVDLVRSRTGRAGAEERTRWTAAWGPVAVAVGAWLLARCFVFQGPWAGFDVPAGDFGVGAARLALLRLELFGGGLKLLAWPSPLTLFRPFRPTVSPTDPHLVVAALATLLFLLALLLAWRRRAGTALFALGFVPASLSVALLRAESLGRFPLSDRFLYLAVFGFALALARLASRLPRPSASGGLILGVASLLGLQTAARIPVWHDEEALFRDAADEAPRSPYVQWGLGRVLLGRFRESGERRYLREAEEAYVRAQDLLIESRAPDTDVFSTSNDFLQANLGYGWCRLYADQRLGYQGSSVAIGIFEELAQRIEELRDRRIEARSLGIVAARDDLRLEQVYTALGVASTLAGRDEEAERAFQRALEENPRYPEAHRNLGLFHERRGDLRLARLHLERALELRPRHWEDEQALATVLLAEGELARAAGIARELVARRPDRPEPLLVLARVHVERDEPEAALERVHRVLELDPENGRAWYLRGQAFLLQGETDRATSALERAVELTPGEFEPCYDLAVLRFRAGDEERGMPLLLRAYELCRDPEILERIRGSLRERRFGSPDPLVELAVVDARRRANEVALEWVERALALDPRHGPALLQRARLARRRGADEEALEDLRRAAELLEESFSVHVELGTYSAELGRREEAREVLERAMELGPPSEWPEPLANQALEDLRRKMAELEDERGG